MDGKHQYKAVENALDAVICAWIGYEYANDRAESLGDRIAAIWTPVPAI